MHLCFQPRCRNHGTATGMSGGGMEQAEEKGCRVQHRLQLSKFGEISRKLLGRRKKRDLVHPLASQLRSLLPHTPISLPVGLGSGTAAIPASQPHCPVLASQTRPTPVGQMWGGSTPGEPLGKGVSQPSSPKYPTTAGNRPQFFFAVEILLAITPESNNRTRVCDTISLL